MVQTNGPSASPLKSAVTGDWVSTIDAPSGNGMVGALTTQLPATHPETRSAFPHVVATVVGPSVPASTAVVPGPSKDASVTPIVKSPAPQAHDIEATKPHAARRPNLAMGKPLIFFDYKLQGQS